LLETPPSPKRPDGLVEDGCRLPPPVLSEHLHRAVAQVDVTPAEPIAVFVARH